MRPSSSSTPSRRRGQHIPLSALYSLTPVSGNERPSLYSTSTPASSAAAHQTRRVSTSSAAAVAAASRRAPASRRTRVSLEQFGITDDCIPKDKNGGGSNSSNDIDTRPVDVSRIDESLVESPIRPEHAARTVSSSSPAAAVETTLLINEVPTNSGFDAAATACLRSLKHLVDQASASATRVSIDHHAFDVARSESLAASVAALEGTANVLRIAAASCGDTTDGNATNANDQYRQMLQSAADNVAASLVSVRGAVFSSVPRDPCNADHLDGVKFHATERIKNFHRLSFAPTALYAQQQNKVHAKQQLLGNNTASAASEQSHSPASPPPPPHTAAFLGNVILPALDVIGSAGATADTLSSAPAAASGLLSSARGVGFGGGDISARIRNCDLMLRRLHTVSSSSSSASASAHPGTLSSSRTLRSTGAGKNTWVVVAASNLHQPPALDLNVWADAEDAIALLRVRYLFQLWLFATRVEKQRRRNAYLASRRICALRKETAYLRVFVNLQRNLLRSRAMAARNLLRENKELSARIERETAVCMTARGNREVTSLQMTEAIAELNRVRHATEQLRRSAMVLDLRRPLVDAMSGLVMERGFIEFRRVQNQYSVASSRCTTSVENNSNTSPLSGAQRAHKKTAASQQHPSVFSLPRFSQLSAVYPPFIDMCNPSQSEDACELIKKDHVERAARRGVAVPGYKAAPSFYEIRVTNGTDLDNSFDSCGGASRVYDKTMATMMKRLRLHSPRITTTTTTTTTTARSGGKGGSSSEATTAPMIDGNPLVAGVFSNIAPLRFDTEGCALINALLGLLQSMPSQEWNIEEGATDQIWRRQLASELLGEEVVANSAATAASVEGDGATKAKREPSSVDAATNVQHAKQGSLDDANGTLLESSSPFSIVARLAAARRGDNLVSAANGSNNNNTNSAIRTLFPNNSFKTTAQQAVDLVSASVAKAAQQFTLVLEHLQHQSTVFISNATRRMLEVCTLDEQRMRVQSDRAHDTEALQREQQEREQGGATTGDFRDDNNAADDGTRSQPLNRLCAVAPPLFSTVTSFSASSSSSSSSCVLSLLRDQGLAIGSPAELLQRPDVLVRALVALFGKHVVLAAAAKHRQTRGGGSTVASSSAPTWAEVCASLLHTLPFRVPMAHAAEFFVVGQNQQQQQPQAYPGVGSLAKVLASAGEGITSLAMTAEHAEALLLSSLQLKQGRELCALLQAHLALTVASAEADARTIRAAGVDRLRLRRMQAALLHFSPL